MPNDDREQSAVESHVLSVLFAITTACYAAALAAADDLRPVTVTAVWIAAFILSPFIWTFLLLLTAPFARIATRRSSAVQRFQSRVAMVLLFLLTVYFATGETFARWVAQVWLVVFALNLLAAIFLRLFSKKIVT